MAGNRKTKNWTIDLIGGVALVVAAAIVAQLHFLQFRRADHYWKLARARQECVIKKVPSRGKIFDRNNRELAATEMVPSIYVAPSRIPNELKRNIAHDLARELNLDFDIVYRRLTEGRGDQVIKRRVDRESFERVMLIVQKYQPRKGEKTTQTVARNAFYVQEENKRLYPWNELASHVIGYTVPDDTGDNRGVAGVEGSYDEQLRGKLGVDKALRTATGVPLEPIDPEVLSSTYGNSLVLTIDATIQRVTEAALKKRVLECSADAGVALVYGVKTGEILAMASVPSFSLGDIQHAPVFALRNRCITDAIEPGSVMKIFTYTSLLEEEKIRSFTEIVDCAGGRWSVAGRTVVDSHAMGAVPVVTAFAQSSNVAAAKLAVTRLQPARFYKHLVDFGFGEKTGIDLPGEAPGLLRHVKDWTAQSVASLAYGYEIQATAIQIAAAAAAIANNGVYMKPHVVKELRNYRGETIRQVLPEKVRRVCSPATSRRMLELMEAVVREGTGKAAALPNYRVGGKTGTTIKLDPETKRYSRGNYIGSFCGVAPLEDPEICIYVWIDNPRGGIYYGGQVAAPVFKEIAQTALKVLNVPPSSGQIPEKSIEVALEEARASVAAGNDVPAEGTERDPAAPGCMPDLRGLTIREAHERLAEMDLVFESRGSGVVVDQFPRPYETIDPREPVLLVLGHAEEVRSEGGSADIGAAPPPLESTPPVGSTGEPPSLQIVAHRRTVAIPLHTETSASAARALIGLPKPALASPPSAGGEAPSDDPDPRVKRGPAPDAGKTVWQKSQKEGGDVLRARPGASAIAPSPTTTDAEKGRQPSNSQHEAGPVRSLYEVEPASHNNPISRERNFAPTEELSGD